MSFLDALKDFLRQGKCDKLVKYQARSLEFKSLSTEYSGAKFSIGDFTTDIQKIQQASEIAATIDDYQYNMCTLSRELKRDDPDWKFFLKARAGAISLLTALRTTLISFKDDPTGEANNLRDIVKTMQDYMQAFAKKVSEGFLTKSTVLGPMATEPSEEEITPENVLRRSFTFVGVSEDDIQRLTDEL
jgi:hypothetical protein